MGGLLLGIGMLPDLGWRRVGRGKCWWMGGGVGEHGLGGLCGGFG